MKTPSPPPPPPSVAVAATHAPPAPALELPRPRRGFFPRGPGPGLVTFALILGVYPSVLATVLFMGAGVDGGFYKSEWFIRGQHHLLITLASILTLGALASLGFVLAAIWRDRKQRGGRLALAMALIATIGWDLMAVNWVRPQLTPIVSRADVLDYIAQPLPVRENGLQALSYDTRVIRADLAIPEHVESDDVPSSLAGPFICTRLGRLYAGPVDRIAAHLTRPDGTGFTLNIARSDCRSWYLQSRIPSRRPQPLADPGTIDFGTLWKDA